MRTHLNIVATININSACMPANIGARHLANLPTMQPLNFSPASFPRTSTSSPTSPHHLHRLNALFLLRPTPSYRILKNEPNQICLHQALFLCGTALKSRSEVWTEV